MAVPQVPVHHPSRSYEEVVHLESSGITKERERKKTHTNTHTHTTQHNTTTHHNNTTQHNTTQHTTTRHNTTQHNTTTHHNTTQHNTTPHNNTPQQHNTTQHNTPQHSNNTDLEERQQSVQNYTAQVPISRLTRKHKTLARHSGPRRGLTTDLPQTLTSRFDHERCEKYVSPRNIRGHGRPRHRQNE